MGILLMLLMQLSLVYGQSNSSPCEITLRVVNQAGRTVPHRVVSFRNKVGSEFVSEFTNLKGRVPCSVIPYAFTVARTDLNSSFADISGTVEVGRPESWLTVLTNPNLVFIGDSAAELSRALPVGYVLKGLIMPPPAKPAWVHIRSAVGSEYIEAAVGSNGEFRIYEGFTRGPYMLYVMDEDGATIHTTILDIKAFAPRDEIQIKMTTEAPSVVVVQ